VAEQRAQRQLSAILAADVAGYSRLVSLDEEGTLARLKALRQTLIDPTITEHRGRIVKAMGDGLLVQFVSAVDAVRCAVDIQRQMAEQNAETDVDRRIEFRIGINVGDVVIDGDDIHGDGVNIAARLEGLSKPSGICVSQTVHDHVLDKLELAFEDAGEQRLKNIARPVRVYLVKTPKASAPSPPHSSSKPSIAVLPFLNMSGDPEQQYFADGITEDIITELSRFRHLLVIARNSSFQYRVAIDVKQIARELGVRYVVEGSIRKSVDRVRITAQLVDANSGTHVWAERFDREIRDVFEIQDELVQAIVAKATGQLEVAEEEQVRRKRTESLAAYDFFLRGLEHFHKFAPTDIAQARMWFEKSLANDPLFAPALARLAEVEATDSLYQKSPKQLNEALAMAKRAVALDPNDSWCHSALGNIHLNGLSFGCGSHVLALQEFEIALRLNPNEPDHMVQLAQAYIYTGRPDAALRLIDRAAQLNPALPDVYLCNRGFASYALRRYLEAAQAFERMASPAYWDHYFLAACYAQLSRMPEARQQIAKAIELAPHLTIRHLVANNWYSDSAELDHLIDGVRKAGLPE
jgi:adenylate cyclase